MEDVTPGWRTTEFWTALISQAVAVLVLIGVITGDDAQTLEAALVQIAIAALAIAGAAAVVWQYIKSRTEVKTAAIETEVLKENLEAPDGAL